MLYARKITEDGWMDKPELDSDSISELGTSNHELSVWKIHNIDDSDEVDKIALTLAMTRSKVEELFIVFINPNDVKGWEKSLHDEDGNSRYSKMNKNHTNFILSSFWDQGFLAEYIHKLIEEEKYEYYNVIRLKELAYKAYKNGEFGDENLKDGQWRKVIKEMKAQEECKG